MGKIGIQELFKLQKKLGSFFDDDLSPEEELELEEWLIESDMSRNQLYEAFQFLIFLEDFGFSRFNSWLESNNIYITNWYKQFNTNASSNTGTNTGASASQDEATFYHYLNQIDFPNFVEFLEKYQVSLKDYEEFIQKLETCCPLPLECSSEYDWDDNSFDYYDNNLQIVPTRTLVS